MGKEYAHKMLEDCHKATSEEAKIFGLVSEVVPHDRLLIRAQVWINDNDDDDDNYDVQELGEEWVKTGREREMRGGGTVEEYKRINAAESAALAEAFVSEKFLRLVLCK